MANEIVWFDSAEANAPTLNNAAGSLIAVLDACLVTGFSFQTLTSVVVASGVATATLAGHGYTTARMLDIAGAGTALVNGRKLITATGSGAFTFPAPGVSDGTITGTITAKRSPLGWSRAHSAGATVGMYSRTDVTATAMSLRIDDSSGPQSYPSARVVMVESFSDVNTYTGPGPTVAQLAGGQYWIKGPNSTTAKPWLLVGDGRTFYLFMDDVQYPASSYGTGQPPCMFGDLKSYRPGDAYGCLLAGDYGSSGGSHSFGTSNIAAGSGPSNAGAFVLSRASNAVGGSVQAGTLGMTTNRFGGQGPNYPSAVDNGMVVSYPILCAESNAAAGYPIRGEMRGIANPLANIPANLLHQNVLRNLTGSSRDWLAVAFMQSGNGAHMLFDITGPWA